MTRLSCLPLLAAPQEAEIIDLFGPAYSMRQVARALGEAFDKELQVVGISSARQSARLVDAGIPRPIADSITEMFDAFNRGLITPQGHRSLVGTTPIDDVIRQYVRAGAARVA